MRRGWIRTINAGAREHGVPYNRLISGMMNADIALNRKVLADLAQTEPLSFLSVLEVTRANDPYLASRADAMDAPVGPFDDLQASTSLLYSLHDDDDDDELDAVDDVPLSSSANSS